MERTDLDYALSLHYLLNGESLSDVIARSEEQESPENQENNSDDDVIIEKIQVNSKRSKPTEFYAPVLKTYIDFDTRNSIDWSEINLNKCAIQSIFDRLKNLYFSKWLTDVNYSIFWDYYGAYTSLSTYKIISSTSTIYVSDSALIRPRIQLMSLVLHILIHIYLYVVSNKTIRLDQHGPEFKNIMKFFNNRIGTSICTSHVFLNSAEEAVFSTQWWQCTGICVNYQPFYGIIRCTSAPNETMNFWSAHHTKCGGMFFKVFEIQRTDATTGRIEKKYVRNVKYMNPRPQISDGATSSTAATKQHKKVSRNESSQVRAFVDLTDDTPREENLCAVINLDDTEFIVDVSDDDDCSRSPHVQNLISHCTLLMSTCCLCKVKIGETRLACHFDTCTGFQQQVIFPTKFANSRTFLAN